MELRRFRLTDGTACGDLFHRAVREGAASRYTLEQRTAWAPHDAPSPEQRARFAARLDQQITWVAEEAGTIEGFLSLRADGYLDLAYVTPERMGRGLAGQLYEKIEAEARALGLSHLTSEASHFARPFFARRGWQVDAPQQIERQGVLIENFRMSKAL